MTFQTDHSLRKSQNRVTHQPWKWWRYAKMEPCAGSHSIGYI